MSARHRKVTYVYRLETEDGRGVFYHGFIHKVERKYGLDWSKPYKGRRPRSPYDMPCDLSDTGPLHQHSLRGGSLAPYRFGFLNLRQYRKAFVRFYRERLPETGVKLVRYAVPTEDVLAGGAQCAFLKERANKVATYNTGDFG